MPNLETGNSLSPYLKQRLFTQVDRVLDGIPRDNLVGALGNSYTGKLFTAQHGQDGGIVTVEFLALRDSAYEATERLPKRPLRERRVLIQNLSGAPVYERLELKEITLPDVSPKPEIYTCNYSCELGNAESGGTWGAVVGFIQQIIDEDKAKAGFTPPVPDIVSTDISYVAPSETGKYPSETLGYGMEILPRLYGDFELGSHVLHTQRAQYLASFLQKFV
jgi:hypothetical protein